MSLKKIITSGILIFILNALLNAQWVDDREARKANLEDEVDELKQKVKDEKKYFANFQQGKEKLLEQKIEEQKSLGIEISSYSREVAQLKREIREIELKLKRIQNNRERINQTIKKLAVSIVQKIDKGIPFEKNRRMAILNALILDIENGKSSASESFIRLMTFLNSEDLIGFDSQVLEQSVKIGGQYVTASVMRIGRIYFAAQTERGTYLYQKTEEGYILDEDTPLDFVQRRNIDLAIKIIQGKKPPKLVKLPFYTKDILVEDAKDTDR